MSVSNPGQARYTSGMSLTTRADGLHEQRLEVLQFKAICHMSFYRICFGISPNVPTFCVIIGRRSEFNEDDGEEGSMVADAAKFSTRTTTGKCR